MDKTVRFRVRVKDSIANVKAMIFHPMETGYRRDKTRKASFLNTSFIPPLLLLMVKQLWRSIGVDQYRKIRISIFEYLASRQAMNYPYPGLITWDNRVLALVLSLEWYATSLLSRGTRHLNKSDSS